MTREDIVESLILSIDERKRPFESKVMREAIKLLKADAPRVLTLEEVRTLQDGALVWLEDNDKADVIPGIVNHVWNSLPNLVSFTVAHTREVKADMLWYGVKWRCWSRRPSPEQMEATLWPGA